MLKTRISIVFFYAFLLFISCEDFTSFKYDAEQFNQGTRIYGVVKDVYRDGKVGEASIIIGTNQTYSDNFGNYSIFVPIGVDEQRDKPVPVTISAYNYRTLASEQILFPGITPIDFELEYLPPVIEKYALFYYGQTIFCQAKITDFQGRETIDSTATVFYYSAGSNSSREELVLPMAYVLSAGPNSGYYQATAPMVISGGNTFNEDIKIYAEDAEGYKTDHKTHIRLNPPDSALFPMSLYLPPTIDRAVMVPYNDQYFIAQAKVFDYQGFDNISKVTLYMYFSGESGQIIKRSFNLERVATSGAIGGWYENSVPATWGYGREFKDKYDIVAVDNEGNKTKITQRVYNVKPDDYLFPPEHLP